MKRCWTVVSANDKRTVFATGIDDLPDAIDCAKSLSKVRFLMMGDSKESEVLVMESKIFVCTRLKPVSVTPFAKRMAPLPELIEPEQTVKAVTD